MDAKSIFNTISSIYEENDKILDSINLQTNKTYETIKIENTASIRIFVNSKSKYISIKSRYADFMDETRYKAIKSDKHWIRYDIETESDLEEISEILLKIYEDIRPSGRMFGCCSRFIECSDALQCTNPNRKHAKNCWYKIHLDTGRIFYGKNENVEGTVSIFDL